MDSTDESHVQLSLGLYVLGALDATERAAVERHLAACADCRAESTELADTVAAVALLPESDTRAIIDEFGIRPRIADPTDSPGTTPAPPPPVAQDSADPDAGPGSASGTRRRPGSTRPPAPAGGGRGPGTRSGRAERYWSRLRTPSRGVLGIGSLVIVVLVSAGVFLGLVTDHRGTGPEARVSVTLAATADAPAGATLSAVAVGRDDGVTVRATVRGLRPGVRYQLYVVTANGTTHRAASWVGSAGTREVTGQVPVALTEVSFFTVARSDGTPVVSAAVPKHS